MPRDYYEVLAVSREADDDEIKKAFRGLARELHPDINRHDPEAENKFKEVAEAYEVLSDRERRAVYDRYGHDGLRSGGWQPNTSGFSNISDIFEAFFGGGGDPFGGAFGGRGRAGPERGRDVAVQVSMTLQEVLTGAAKDIEFEVVTQCSHCNGNGAEPGTPIETCPRCEGTGALQSMTRTVFGQVVRTHACDRCGGDGRIAQTPCAHCRGSGQEVDARSRTVEIPAGIDDGQRVRITGQGHAGGRGGPAGDLYVLVMVERDPRFERHGDDLVTRLDVPFTQAALGGRRSGLHARGRGRRRARARFTAGQGGAVAGPGAACPARPGPRRPARGAERDDPELPDRRAARVAAALRGVRKRRHLRREARRGPVRPHPPGVSRLIRLAVRCPAQQADVVLAELLELAPGGFEQVDAPDGRDGVVEYAIYGAAGELPDLGAIRAAAGDGIVEVDSREVPDDWDERWKRFYFPVLVGGRLYVRPPWEEPAQRGGSRRS